LSTVKVMGWNSVVKALETSETLLQATIAGQEETVATLIEQAHQANVSILKYNDENSLSCVISLAYYSAQKKLHPASRNASWKKVLLISFLSQSETVIFLL